MPRYFFHVFHERVERDAVGEELSGTRHGQNQPSLRDDCYKASMAGFSRVEIGEWK